MACSVKYADAQTNELRWNLKKGQKLQVVTKNDALSVMETPAGEQKIPVKSTMTMTWEVLDAKDGVYEIGQTVNRVQVNMTNPQLGEINYDSDDKDSEPQGMAAMAVQQFKSILGKQTKVKINNLGVVQKSESR